MRQSMLAKIFSAFLLTFFVLATFHVAHHPAELSLVEETEMGSSPRDSESFPQFAIDLSPQFEFAAVFFQGLIALSGDFQSRFEKEALPHQRVFRSHAAASASLHSSLSPPSV